MVIASARLEQALSANATAADFRWAAIGLVLTGDPTGALTRLEKAAALARADADIDADLAATYLIRATQTDAAPDLVRAIDAARRGIAHNPRHAGCWFNLALALRRVGLFAMANEAFAQVAQLDSGGWADEANAHLRQGAIADSREALKRGLDSQVVDGDLAVLWRALPEQVDIVEELLERRLLTRWAASILAGQPAISSRLQTRAHDIAARITGITSDRHPTELVTYFDTCTASCAQGWIDHITAMTAWDEERFADARRAQASADAVFGTSPSVVNAARILLRITLGRIDGRGAETRDWARTFRAQAERSAYLMVTGRLTWQLALLEGEAGNFGGSVALYRVAADTLARARDREGAAMVDSLLSAKYQQLGDFPLAWRHALAAMRRLDACRELRRRAILAATAALATTDGLDETALAFRVPLLETARRKGAAIYLARLLSEEATTLARLGRLADAQARLAEAEANLSRIEDPGAAALSRALVRTAQARVLASSSPLTAAGLFAEAAEIYRARGNLFATPVLELERGRTLVQGQAVDRAEQAFERGIEAAEDERQHSQLDSERVALLSARWDLYASLIDLRLRRHDEAAATALLDRARAANLLEAVGATKTTTTSALGRDTAAIEYAVLPSGVHGWITVGDVRSHFLVPLASDQLETRVEDYLRAVQRRDAAEVRRRSGELFTALIGPVRDRIGQATHLVIVPDGPLHALPFAALEEPVSGRAVVDRASVTMTPSLALYRQQRPDRTSSSSLDAVVIGNSNQATDVNGKTLPALRGADREMAAVAALYRRPSMLSGEQATRRRVLEMAPRGRVLHFAGHAVVDQRDASLSRLLVSPAEDDPVGAVFASDLSRSSLDGVKLVVLSACETAGGRLSRGEGVVGLARAFLRAGASSVIATLWPVDDDRAVEIAVAIHQELQRGRSASEALRLAQIRVRQRGPVDVLDWAAPIVLGRDVSVMNPVPNERSVRR